MTTFVASSRGGKSSGRDCWTGTEPAWYRPAPRDLSTAPAHVVCALHLRWVEAGRPAWPVFSELSVGDIPGSVGPHLAPSAPRSDRGTNPESGAAEICPSAPWPAAAPMDRPIILDTAAISSASAVPGGFLPAADRPTSAGAAPVAPALLGGV